MPNIIEIDDLRDARLQMFAGLTEAQLRDRAAPEKGAFIAESVKVIGYALDAGCAPLALLMERRHIEGDARELLRRCGDAPVYTADREVLSALTGYALTRGVLCAMRRPKLPSAEAVCEGARRVAVLDGIGDPSNVGAIFRSAAALGCDAVLLTPTCCDPLYRKAARVSMGTVFQIPWAKIGGTPEPGMSQLARMGFKTAALALTDRSVSIDDPILAKEERLALLLGSEGNGLCEATLRAADYTVKIPMFHGVDSLNVAAAAAVAFWQTRVIGK